MVKWLDIVGLWFRAGGRSNFYRRLLRVLRLFLPLRLLRVAFGGGMFLFLEFLIACLVLRAASFAFLAFLAADSEMLAFLLAILDAALGRLLLGDLFFSIILLD